MAGAAGRGAECVAERSLALAAPHDAVNGITAQVIFGQCLPEGLHSRVVEACGAGALAGQGDFQQRFQALEVAAE